MLRGKNINLRLVEEKDLEKLVEWRNSDEMYQVFYEFPIPMSGQKEWFGRHLSSGDLLFIIECSTSAIGTVGLQNIDLRNRHAEFGRFMIPDIQYRNKGYGYQAVRLILEYSFDHLNLNRVYLDVLEYNSAAISLYEKMGFEQEGIKQKHIYKNGRYHNLICMSLLKENVVWKRSAKNES